MGSRGNGQRRQRQGQYQGLQVNLACLPSDLRELVGIRDVLRPRVQVALTARRETHSGLFAGLEHAEQTEPEREEERHPPERLNPRREQRHERRRAHAEHDEAEDGPLPALAWPDVRNAYGLHWDSVIYPEIARRLKISVATVKMHVFAHLPKIFSS